MSMTESQDIGANHIPTVSVCVVIHNSARTIGPCLLSILDQKGIDFEIIVVDDNSNDDGVNIAASLIRPGDRLILNESHLGLSASQQKALQLARGRLIQFAHSDDCLQPLALQSLARFFDHSDVGLAFAPRMIIGDDCRLDRRPPFWMLWPHNIGSSLVMQILARFGAVGSRMREETCVMFRRDLALDLGGFKSKINQWADLDLWLHIMLRSTVCFYPEDLSLRDQRCSVAPASTEATNRGRLDQPRILAGMIQDPASPPMVRTLAATWWALCWIPTAMNAVWRY